MILNEIFEEKEYDGVTVRRSKEHPNVWVSEDGRVQGVKGRWLKLQKYGKPDYLFVQPKYRVMVTVHRLIAETWVVNSKPNIRNLIDHINGMVGDNHAKNLRWVTYRGNNNNRACHREGTTQSIYNGVTWNKLAQKWQAKIMIDGHNRGLNYFDDEDDAGRAYDSALVSLGEDPVNFPTN